MVTEAFVDVSYRGLALGRRLHLRDVGPTTAYCEAPAPMPVGSELTITAEGGLELPVRVVHVTEQVAGADAAPGMRVTVGAASDAGKAWWKSLVTTEDPIGIADGGALLAIPSVVSDDRSGAGMTVPASAPPPPATPLPSVRAATTPPPAASSDAVGGRVGEALVGVDPRRADADEEAAPPEPDRESVPEPVAEEPTDRTTPPAVPREANRTMVMSAVEIAEVIGAREEAAAAGAAAPAAVEPAPEPAAEPAADDVELEADEPPPDFTGRFADKRRQASRTLVMNVAELKELTEQMAQDAGDDSEAPTDDGGGDAADGNGNGDPASPATPEAKGKRGRRKRRPSRG